MLTRVTITNYRGFKSYQMDGLTQVNLLVGKNNSGKTALLEGVQFLTSGGDAGVLVDAAQRRGELVLKREDRPTRSSIDIAHFFYGHSLAIEGSFSIAGDNGYRPVTAKVLAVAQKNGRTESGEVRERAGPAGFFLRISRGKEDPSQFNISRDGGVDFEVSPRLGRVGSPRRIDGPQARFVGPDSLNTVEIATMWDEVTLTGQEVDVSQAMRVLDPDVESLHILAGMFAMGYYPSRGGIVVGLKGKEGRLPLGSMGDGMRRLLTIATSLAFTKEGFLFADEVDTGLHYSVMQDLWKLIVNKAVESNTQVFATTHSWDCIEGLSLFCEQNPRLMSRVAIHKIDREVSHSVPFSGEEIVRMTKADIDPR